MFFRLALIFLSLTAFTFVTPINLIKDTGQPSSALLKLFDVLGLENDGTAEQLNQIAQEKWLRKPGQERWEMPDRYEGKTDEIHSILRELGVMGEILPVHKIYDCIIIHGATVNTMRKRIKFLEKLWQSGVWARKIIFLTGQRPLDPTKENVNVLFEDIHSPVAFRKGWVRPTNIPKTESEAAAFLWDQTITNPDLRSRKPYIVAAPMVIDPKTGQTKRPNTADSIYVWLKGDIFMPAGRCLAISNNPYIPYQDQTLRCILQQRGFLSIDSGSAAGMTNKRCHADENQHLVSDVTLETVGPAADKDVSISVHLDNIARWLYTEIHTCKKGIDSSKL